MDTTLLIAAAALAVLALAHVALLRRHHRCKATLERVAGERNEARLSEAAAIGASQRAHADLTNALDRIGEMTTRLQAADRIARTRQRGADRKLA